MLQMPLLPWICVLLWTNLQETHGLTSFPNNVVVARTHDATPVTLTCDSVMPGPTTWMFARPGEMMDEVELTGHDFIQDGRNLKVSFVEEPMVGEYSCWHGDTKLSSTYLVLVAEEMPSDSPLSCWATSYDCVFNCQWRHADYSAVRIGLGNDCAEGEKTCTWVSNHSQHAEHGRQFQLSHFLTPYAEETSRMEVTVEAMNDNYFHRTTQRFYLRDIIKPESPHVVKYQEVGHQLNVSIEPASSWSTPHSYFKLEHEIEYVYRDNGEKGYSTSHRIPKEICKFRVRSRDSLVLSAWSQWTQWTNVNL